MIRRLPSVTVSAFALALSVCSALLGCSPQTEGARPGGTSAGAPGTTAGRMTARKGWIDPLQGQWESSGAPSPVPHEPPIDMTVDCALNLVRYAGAKREQARLAWTARTNDLENGSRFLQFTSRASDPWRVLDESGEWREMPPAARPTWLEGQTARVEFIGAKVQASGIALAPAPEGGYSAVGSYGIGALVAEGASIARSSARIQRGSDREDAVEVDLTVGCQQVAVE